MNRFQRLYVIAITAISILLTLTLPAMSKSLVTFDSLYSFESVSDVQLSPDGQWLTFVTRKSFVNKNRSRSTIWLMDANGKSKREISPLEKSAWRPRWVDNGKRIAFLTSTEKGVQVFAFELLTRDVKQITHYPTGVGTYVWSPTNEGVAFTSSVYPENNSLEYFLLKKRQKKEIKHTGKLYDKLLFRPYSRWDDGTIKHIFYQRFHQSVINNVSPGKHHAPTSHLGGSQDIAFSPDGKKISFTMNTDKVKAISTNNDVFTADISGGNRKKISTSPGCDNDPRFSADGNYFMYLQMARAQYEADQKDIILIDLKTGNRKNLTESFDRTLSQVFWSNDSKFIYFTCSDKGFRSLYKIQVTTGTMKKILGDVYFSNVNIAPDGKSIYLLKTVPDRPSEIFRYDMTAKIFKQLTHFSDKFVEQYALASSEIFWYKGANNDPVQGFISFPYDYDKNKKYPMVMLFHGGPEGAFGFNYTNYCGNIHLLSAQGYIVAKINPHGSSAYGLEFQESLLGNWGIVDYEDVMKAMDYLIKTYPAINADKIAGMGRSYGGFLVNFLNGKTDRFKCFVSVDGIFDQVMSYYATDELWFMETEFKGTPTDSPEIYKRSSPMTYVENFKTPTLVIHGGRDFRVDLAQGIGMYTALQRKGIPSQLLVFPDEPHYFRKLQTWKYVYDVRLKWLKKWLLNTK